MADLDLEMEYGRELTSYHTFLQNFFKILHDDT